MKGGVVAMAWVLGANIVNGKCIENPLCGYCDINNLVMTRNIEQSLFHSFEKSSYIAESDLLSDYGFSGAREYCKTFCCAATKTQEPTTSCRDCNESPMALMNEHITMCQFNQLCMDCSLAASESESEERRRYLAESTAIFTARAANANGGGFGGTPRRLAGFEVCPEGAVCVGCGINGTVTNTCDITCPENGCNGETIICPESGRCTIKCTGKDSCRDSSFKCPSPSGCTVECLGDTVCLGATIISTGDLNLKCEGEGGTYHKNACRNMVVECPNTKIFTRTCDGKVDSPLASDGSEDDDGSRRRLLETTEDKTHHTHRRLLGAMDEPSEPSLYLFPDLRCCRNNAAH
jgi:hypothetical protein